MDTKPQIDLPLARMCANACARAYPEATISSNLAHCLVVRAEGPAILAFRGSEDIRDLLTDFQVRWVQTVHGGIHSGFFNSALSVLNQILKLDQRQSPAPVIVTGHSKGAAEALIVARWLVAAGRPVEAVVTFGGPRVGDAEWRKSYNAAGTNIQQPTSNIQHPTLGDATQRWVHEEDLVPRLPVWCSGYRHVGHEMFLSAFGGVEVDPPVWRMAASDIWGTFWGYRAGVIEQAADHPISKYQEHIKGL